MKPLTMVLTCEHGGNDVPDAYRYLFVDHEDILATHQAQDIGSAAIADHLHDVFNCEYVKSTITRLLIDCNRKLSHPKCFSEFTKNLSEKEKQKLIDNYYLPYREEAFEKIKTLINEGYQVLHLSIHSFMPKAHGVERNAEISFLYDSRRHGEKEVARIWRNLIINRPSEYRVRVNYPFPGTSDGFTASLRKQFSEHEYLGIEVECNQALCKDESTLNRISITLSSSLKELLELL